MFKPGIYPGIPNHDYHADKTIMSSSDAKLLCEHDGAIKWLNRTEPKDNDALRFGTAAHAYLLENIEPTVCEYKDFRSKAAKEWKAAHKDANWVTEAEMGKLRQMRDAVLANPHTASLLDERGQAEMSIFWEDAETGAHLKCRPDWLIPPGIIGDAPVIVDYKTCTGATPYEFAGAIAKRGYDIQAAWYINGVTTIYPDAPEPEFWFLAQEKTEPYKAGAYRLAPEHIEQAQEAIAYAISVWLDLKDLNAPARQKYVTDQLYDKELFLPKKRFYELQELTVCDLLGDPF